MPAGQLDRDVEGADDLGQQFGVAAPPERGVEVDQVHPLRAVVLPGQRGVERSAVVGLAAGLALDQPDGQATGHVDGGQQFQLSHGRAPSRRRTAPCDGHSVPTQVASRWAPASPDFSGWNWVADSAPRSMAATNGTP